jgi:hypothetical protein
MEAHPEEGNLEDLGPASLGVARRAASYFLGQGVDSFHHQVLQVENLCREIVQRSFV